MLRTLLALWIGLLGPLGASIAHSHTGGNTNHEHATSLDFLDVAHPEDSPLAHLADNFWVEDEASRGVWHQHSLLGMSCGKCITTATCKSCPGAWHCDLIDSFSNLDKCRQGTDLRSLVVFSWAESQYCGALSEYSPAVNHSALSALAADAPRLCDRARHERSGVLLV